MIWLLGGVIIATTLAFTGLYLGAAWAYDLLRDRYQARRKHVLHTTAADERVFPRTLPPPGDKAQREAAYAELRALPAPGLTMHTDRNVWLPRTLPAEPGPVAWTPPAHALAAVSKRYPVLDGGPARVPPSCPCGSYGHRQAGHDAASPALPGSRPEPVTHPDPPGAEDSTFVRALLALPVDRVHEAFDGVRQ